MHLKLESIKPLIERASALRLDPELAAAVIMAESGGQVAAVRYEKHYRWLFKPAEVKPSACSEETEIMLQKTSFGLMQVMGAVAREHGFKGWLTELCRAETGLEYGCRHLASLLKRWPDPAEAVSAYNQGSPRRNSKGEFQNQAYVDRVISFWRETDPAPAKETDPGEAWPPDAPRIIAVMKTKGFAVFKNHSRPYNLNIVGLRSKSRTAGAFDDFITVFWPEGGTWVQQTWPATTDPSAQWLSRLGNEKGTAILRPGQYRGAYAIGFHRSYEALRQVGPVTVVRDANRDDRLDDDSPEDTGLFGINIHRASATRVLDRVGPYSAGCQVFQNPADFQKFMDICRRAQNHWGPRFSYTLLTQNDFNR